MRRAQGCITRYRDGWRAIATVHDHEGNARRVSKVVHGSRKDAERVLAELLKGDRRGKPRTFGDILDEYLRDCDLRVRRGELQAKTAHDYRAAIEGKVRPALGRIVDPTPWHVRRFLDGIESNRRAAHTTLRQVCNFAERRGLLESNPMRQVEPPPPPRLVAHGETYSADEVAAIFDALEGEPEWFQTAVAIAIGCGLRRGEICALLGSDFDGQRLTVSKAYGKDAPKTPNGVRTVSVPASLMPLIRPTIASKPLVSVSGVSVNPDTLTHRWRRFTRSHGIRYLPFKNLRHTSLTMAYEATGDIYAVSRRAGHAGIAITTRYYARPDQSIDDALGAALSESIEKGRG